jgi:hypothetical protein
MDIDKAYIMGHSFDDNGVYIGWSNMFNYSNIETLRASEQLPMPTGKRYSINEQGFDITNIEYDTLEGVAKINKLIEVLNYLNSNNITSLKASNDNKLLQDIISHEATKLPHTLKLESFKNYISSHIQTVVQDVRNAMMAYTQVAMDEIRYASEHFSTKGSTAREMTLYNPSVLYEM